MKGVLPDQAQLLSTVDRQKILNKIYKSEPELQDIGKFYITDDPMEEENWSKMLPKDKQKILKLNAKIKKSINLKKVIFELTNYKEKYQEVPTIYNYLTMAYHNANLPEKYYDSLIETVERFPGYLFGKISLSEYYLNNNEFFKIPRLLDNKFEITQHYPTGKEIFHISEVRGFYFITGRYFAQAGKIEKAYRSYFLLNDLDNNHETTEILGHEILKYELDIFKDGFNIRKRKK
ncbi:MAG: hypothetical protein ISS19_10890 [Bacteroidales bacterium]|nr:hypothetical protein [Bacteroidales bacterium]